MDAVLRFKYDPRADGRAAQPGELVAFWVQWHCPDDDVYQVQIVQVGDDAEDGTTSYDCTTWLEVEELSDTVGVALPSHPTCPTYG